MKACAATDDEIELLFKKFGSMIASPKLDGIRCSVQNETALTKSLKQVPNEYVQTSIGTQRLNGYDGELIVGSPTLHGVCNRTRSGVMRKAGEPDFKLYVFDHCWDNGGYQDRLRLLKNDHPDIVVVPQIELFNMADVLRYENTQLDLGYEGIVLRDPTALYKQGKSTPKQGGSIKIKRFVDSEARITGMEEKMHNGNEAKTNELGRTQRSSHKENLVPLGTMGKLVGVDVHTGIEVKIGSGFSHEKAQEYWDNRNTSNTIIGKLAKYKHFAYGVKEKPRHAVFLGMRDERDM